MAQKVVLIDDLEGSEATRTIRFSYEGKEYEIDLSDQNVTDMATTFGRYTSILRADSGGVISVVMPWGPRKQRCGRDRVPEVLGWAPVPRLTFGLLLGFYRFLSLARAGSTLGHDRSIVGTKTCRSHAAGLDDLLVPRPYFFDVAGFVDSRPVL